MDQNKPNQYIVRVWQEHSGDVTYRPWAFTAADAKMQIELQLSKSSRSFNVMYVGPVNLDCKCLNECRCGINMA